VTSNVFLSVLYELLSVLLTKMDLAKVILHKQGVLVQRFQWYKGMKRVDKTVADQFPYHSKGFLNLTQRHIYGLALLSITGGRHRPSRLVLLIRGLKGHCCQGLHASGAPCAVECGGRWRRRSTGPTGHLARVSTCRFVTLGTQKDRTIVERREECVCVADDQMQNIQKLRRENNNQDVHSRKNNQRAAG
jgi:hypothetical protein